MVTSMSYEIKKIGEVRGMAGNVAGHVAVRRRGGAVPHHGEGDTVTISPEARRRYASADPDDGMEEEEDGEDLSLP